MTDASSLAGYYRKHGQCIAGDGYCTKAAQKATGKVLCEVAAWPSPRK